MQRHIVLAMIVLGTITAHAQRPDPPTHDEDQVTWTATAEAGLVLTTGSSETTTASGGLKASRRSGNNKLVLEASAAYARSGLRAMVDQNGNGVIDDESEIATIETVTAETLASKLRYDRALTRDNALYVAALASRDLPAGKLLVLGGQAGYSRSLARTKTASVVLEGGYDYAREELNTGPAVQIHSARAFVGYTSAPSEGVAFDVSGEVLSNLNTLTLPTTRNGRPVSGDPLADTRLNVKAAVSARLGRSLAFQTSFEARYDNRPGPLTVKDLAPGFVPEAARVDTLMKASLIFTFVDTAHGKTAPRT